MDRMPFRRWRRPPSRRRLVVMPAAPAIAPAIVLVERTVGRPDRLRTERAPRLRPPHHL